jgi:hypothetical protein
VAAVRLVRAGGTMGVVYGAGSLWQWRLRRDEPGHEAYLLAAGAGWRDALDFEGSRYVGLIACILDGLPLADVAPNWRVTLGRRCLLVPDTLYVGCTGEGGRLLVVGAQVPRRYRVVDPRSGAVLRGGTRASAEAWMPDEGGGRACTSAATRE